jgi:hypothetical protein
MGAAVAPVGVGLLAGAAGIATGGAALPAIGLGLSAMGAASSVMGGYSKATADQTNALEYQQQARFAALQAKVDEADRLTILNRSIGSNKAAAGAANISIDSPSVQAIVNQNKDQVAEQIGLTNLTAGTTAGRLQIAAQQSQSAAGMDVLSGYGQGATSIFSGVNDFMKVGSVPAATTPSSYSGGLGAGTLASGADY